LTPDGDVTAGVGDILVPVGGATIHVLVDGVSLGDVSYNQCRGTTAAGPVPAGPVLLVPGAAATFTWTYSASGNGLVAFSVTGVGRTCGATPVLAAAPVVSATIEATKP
ncbi:MAG: hypothetical protein WCJ30_22840, partial [Deltaproteobacteria bacterium]